MATHLHRDSNENLIVEIIKVIPGTSKKKGGGSEGVEGGRGMGVQSSRFFKTKLGLTLVRGEWGQLPQNELAEPAHLSLDSATSWGGPGSHQYSSQPPMSTSDTK